MRYRLRTLLIVLALGPPLVWLTWSMGSQLAARWLIRPLDRPFVRATNGEIVELENRGPPERYSQPSSPREP